jgi:hypothetical protein
MPGETYLAGEQIARNRKLPQHFGVRIGVSVGFLMA